jgi:hypothetical protein
MSDVCFFSSRGSCSSGYPCPHSFNPADHLFMKVLYSMDKQLALVSADLASSSPHPGSPSRSASPGVPARSASPGLQTNGHHEKASLEGQAHADAPTGSNVAVPDLEAAAGEGGALVAGREAAAKNAYEHAAKKEDARVAGLLQRWMNSSEHTALMKHVDNPLSSPLPDPSSIRAERPGGLYAFRLLAARRWKDLLRDRMKLRMQVSARAAMDMQKSVDSKSIMDTHCSAYCVLLALVCSA